LVPVGDKQVEVYVDRSPACGEDEPKAFVLVFLANGWRAEQFAAAIAANRWHEFPVEVWCENYPGHGKSTGSAKMKDIPPAALASYDALRERAGNRPIFLGANSLGCISALYVAGQRPVSAVIVQNPPPLRRLILSKFGWWNLGLVAGPVALSVPHDMNLPDTVSQVPATIPALFIQAMDDTYILPSWQNLIIDAYAGPKTILHVPGIGHNDGVPPDYETQVQAWIRTRWDATFH